MAALCLQVEASCFGAPQYLSGRPFPTSAGKGCMGQLLNTPSQDPAGDLQRVRLTS